MSYPIYDYRPDVRTGNTFCLGHANGFPPEVYIPFMRTLPADGRAVALPARPLWGDVLPESLNDWSTLADDFLAGIEQHQLGQVVALGHSMSGTALMMAAVKKPSVFKAIVLIDPVVVPRVYLRLLRLLRWLPIEPNHQLIQGALKRRRQWASVDEAYQNFRQRSLFRQCSDEVVRLYAESITQPDATGVILRYTPEWEARIYRTMSLDVWRYVPKIQIPCGLVIGAKSNTFLPQAEKLWRKLRPDIPIGKLPDVGHLLPLEAPQEVGDSVQKLLTSIQFSYNS